LPDFLTNLHRSGIVAVIRADRAEDALAMARCAISGGISLVEISCHTPSLGKILAQLQAEFDRVWFGVGTITDRARAVECIEMGSKFLFSPIHEGDLIRVAKDRGIPIVAGAATPSEIFQAWQRGADGVKVFPIANLGGADYIKAIKAVFPHIPLIPTGGVTIENANQLLQAGAIALGASGYLFPPTLVKAQDWDGITKRVRQLIQTIRFNAD
jgi:2-dehydro-3-deoxyphosphogluconate aldolase/(4S)-4-hydroxy-2-oxoglutarate aldolase